MSMPETERCQNCEKEIQSVKMAMHFGYCRRNIVKCEVCRQPYDKNFYEEHHEEFHLTKQCQFCQLKLKRHEVEGHKGTCEFRPKYCEYCDLNVPAKDFGRHFKQCEARTNRCELCEVSIINKNYAVHVATCKGKTKKEEMRPRADRNDYMNNFGMEDSLSRFQREDNLGREMEKGFKKEKGRALPKRQTKHVFKQQVPKKKELPLHKGPIEKKPIKKNVVRNPQQISRTHFNQNYFPSYSLEDFDRSEYEPKDPFAYQSDYLQQSLYREELPSRTRPSINNDFGELTEEDQMLQQTLFESGHKAKSYNKRVVRDMPSDFMSEEIMNSSFYGDILDIEKQKAIETELSKQRKSDAQSKRR